MFRTYRFVNSTAIAMVAYDRELETLRVIFQNGGAWDYLGVPLDAYAALVTATSVGTYHARHIRGIYESHRVRCAYPLRFATSVDHAENCRYLLNVIAQMQATAALG